MYSSILTSAAFALALVLQANAHAMPSPALGVSGLSTRSDVQRPSTSAPCGSVNIASTLDTSTAVPADSDGSVTFNFTNFNSGADGSRSVSVEVDPTGTGKKFVTAEVTTNGDAAPTNVGSQPITLSLPAGTKCSGGKEANLCLLSVKSTSGFGGCAVVSQLNTSGSESSVAAPAAQSTTSATSAAASASTKSCNKRRALGTRAPRALRRSLHENPVFAGTMH
ncbi:hypothetical protein DFH07DRAFT_941360 [Mycena maculata]|uniref:Gas1-like protein n=1 Tax=Mycena maculata TaxID=230809 RepID=A0AAD7NA34_9AGAR|nr:hypothetical protein DFH07DRAFT_941360 [Mycena maculata]